MFVADNDDDDDATTEDDEFDVFKEVRCSEDEEVDGCGSSICSESYIKINQINSSI